MGGYAHREWHNCASRSRRSTREQVSSRAWVMRGATLIEPANNGDAGAHGDAFQTDMLQPFSCKSADANLGVNKKAHRKQISELNRQGN